MKEQYTKYMENAIDRYGCVNHDWMYVKMEYNHASCRAQEVHRSSGWERKNGTFYR
jgi:hypothetical protein